MMESKILLVDDHNLFRQGLRSLLERIPGVQIAGEAENGKEAVALCEKLKPDIVIMDITMPDLNGVDATRRIVASCPGTRVLVLSMYSSRRFIEDTVKAGASGYLLKSCDFNELSSAIAAIRANHAYLSPAVASVLMKAVGDSKDNAASDSPLTTREREVLLCLAGGKTPKEIALQLNVSHNTVQTHRRNIMEKLGIFRMADLVKYAIREGFLPPGE